jgi:signal transduction histidine kinase
LKCGARNHTLLDHIGMNVPVRSLESGSHQHAVQFYGNQHFLHETVAGFLHDGLQAGQPVVVIATEARRRGLQRRLRARGIDAGDVGDIGRRGQIAWYDARQTLDLFMNGPAPDAERFRKHVGSMIRESRTSCPNIAVRAYGEMVDLLWSDGNMSAAIHLEQLWNELAESHPFSLLCAYNLANFFKESDAAQLLEVCRQHTSVMPAETYDENASADGRTHAIVILQQRAQMLEQEIEHRKVLEQALRNAVIEQRKAERDRERLLDIAQAAQAEAAQASRLKDEFVALISHELRAPLGAIRGWTEIANKYQTDPTVTRRALSVIDRNSRSLTGLIDELLDISKIISRTLKMKSERVDLGMVLDAAVETVRPAVAQKTLALHVNAAPTECVVMGDSTRLQQVVCNLLSNAVKFTPAGGRIDISLEEAASHACLSVHDTGRGIPETLLPHVFDPFRQGDTDGGPEGGLGLGLALARHLVESHGGAISVTSPGAALGSTFTVRLPLAVARSAAPALEARM